MCHDIKEIHLRPLYDLGAILSVMDHHQDSFFTRDLDRKSLAEKITKYGHFVVAMIHEETAGFVGFYANDSTGKTAFISTIVVDTAYQGFGIGSALVRECIRISAEKGMQKCRLEVDRRNQKAIRFYERLGFARTDVASEHSDFYEYHWREGDVRQS